MSWKTVDLGGQPFSPRKTLALTSDLLEGRGGQRKPISICSADADGGSGLVSAIEKNLAHTPVYAADECLQQESRDARARRGDSLHVVQLRQGSRLTENVASNGGWRNGSAVGSGGRHPFAGW
jgi:hypothetical protein